MSSPILQIGDFALPFEEVLPKLASYQMLPQLVYEMVLDQAIGMIECTPEEIAIGCRQFEQQVLNSASSAQDDVRSFLVRYCMTPASLEATVIRALRIEKFKEQTWGSRVESYFLQQKFKLDQVVYRVMRVSHPEVAQELYFRISEGEGSFAALAREYSEGDEAEAVGLAGPVELGQLPSAVAQFLASAVPHQVLPPLQLKQWFVLLQLEKFIPAQLDAAMRQRLLNALFSTWIQSQIRSALN
ncbi:peptidylprolyl isomerase [Cyanobacteria bacterium FACHB-502]|uniref:peptidylprolyl isomerase n=1 Tax=Leptolyngbya sp. GB1-A1 TaxID=2933908 RepID=UPI001988CE18|nr:peptidylprolyl isomerase [Cyanobacteria bacterium FACHB-502]